MKSSARGADTLQIEVANIDQFGLWILVQNKEYFLPYDEFPWFRKGTVEQILRVELLHQDHLYWPELAVRPAATRWGRLGRPGRSMTTEMRMEERF